MLLKESWRSIIVLITFIGSSVQVTILCLINFFFVRGFDHAKERFYFVLILSSSAFLLFNYIGIIGIFIPVVLLMFFNYRYKKDLMVSITAPLFSVMILVISDHLSFLTGAYLFDLSFEMINAHLSYYSLHLLFFLFFSAVLCLVTKIVNIQMKHYVHIFKHYFLFLLALTVMTIAFIYFNILMSNRTGFSSEVIQFNSYIFLAYFVLFITILGLLLSSVIKEVKVESKQEEYKQLRLYSENLEEMYGELQKFRHDYINILSSMSEYIRLKDMDRLEVYFNEKVMPTSQGIKKDNYKLGALKNVKVIEVKGVLVSKLIKAQDLGIDISIEAIESVDQIQMEYISLCRCLGIILDNAIEETEQYEGSSIHIAFIKKQQAVLIVVANTIGGEIPKLYKLFEQGYSTKGENRGLGLSNLKEMISKCENVTLDTKITGRMFFQELEIADVD